MKIAESNIDGHRASRAYELNKGHRPTSASDLVPDYLKAIPQNPITRTNLILMP
jgi:hypothetical protein